MSGDDLKRSLVAEFLGTMFLVTAAVASVILPFTLDGSTVALAVFINAVSVAFVLFALIEAFKPISGAHFNPAVTLAMLVSGDIEKRRAAWYVAAQFAGGFAGLMVAHLMFLNVASTMYADTGALLSISHNVKGPETWFAEFIGTFALVGVIFGCSRGGSRLTSLCVAMLVGGMLVATSSTMFANPAVAVPRIFTYAMCGIAPESAAFFIAAEIMGAISAAAVLGYLYPKRSGDDAAESAQSEFHAGLEHLRPGLRVLR